MIELIKGVIDFIGPSNSLTILVFLAGVFIAFYFYYRTFFRLVFTTARVCANCNQIDDWHYPNTPFTSRIMVYNNGRKSLTPNELLEFRINSNEGTLNSVSVIKGQEYLDAIIVDNEIMIDFNYLDSRNSFVLEINHNGKIEIDGRVSESGKILHTETRFWVWFNIIIISILALYMSSTIGFQMHSENPNIPATLMHIASAIGVFWIIRIIHALLFIPDSLTSYYLNCTDKFNREFKRQFK